MQFEDSVKDAFKDIRQETKLHEANNQHLLKEIKLIGEYCCQNS